MSEKFKAELGLDNSEFKRKLKESEGPVSKFGGFLKKIGGLMAAAFSIGSIVGFTKEAVKLAGELEGVRKGFMKIAEPGLLDDLRKATKGTVTDMELMARAVEAANFGIPVKELSKLLAFASARAIQTGRDVDYMVNSIIIGLGRKSPKILDNLGISATALAKELKGVSAESATIAEVTRAVGSIAEREMVKMGGLAETTGLKIQKLNTAWTNFKTSFGERMAESPVLQKLLDSITAALGAGTKQDYSVMSKVELQEKLVELEAKKQYHIAEQNRLADEYDQLSAVQLIKKKKLNDLWEDQANWTYKTKQEIEKIQNILTEMPSGDEVILPEKTLKIMLSNLDKLNLELSEIDANNTRAIVKKKIEIGLLEEEIKLLGTIHRLKTARSLTDILKLQEWKNGLPTGDPLAEIFGFGGKKEAMGTLRPNKIKIPGINQQTEEWENAWEDSIKAVISFMADAFGEVFERIGEGSMKGLGSQLLGSFGQLISDFGKMLVTLGTMWLLALTLMTIPTIPTALAAIAIGAGAIALGGLMKGASKRMAENLERGGSGGYSPQANQVSSVNVQGVIKGKDIYLSSQRYSGELNTGT